MKEIKTEDYHLTSISNNRYKIDVLSFEFRKTHAVSIPGCYFSGPQKSWVMPQSITSLDQFLKLFPTKQKTMIREKSSKHSYDKALKDFTDQLTLKRYSENTIVVYKEQIYDFLNIIIKKIQKN